MELETRVATLESRMQKVESWLGLAEAQPAYPIEASKPVAPIERPEPVPRLVEDDQDETPPAPPVRTAPQPNLTPAPRRAKPAPALNEVNVGSWLLSRVGGIALVLAAGFLFHYAATRGLLTPAMRLAFGFAAGAALVGMGEWQSRKLLSFSAALTGAGIAILYVSSYAGFALYGFYSEWVALTLATLATVGGLAQAMRHDVEAIAGLAAAGGFLAPALVLNLNAQPLAILTYVLILNVGLGALRMRTGWRSPEIIAWIGTPFAAAVPLARVPLAQALTFLMTYVVLFSVRPRLQPGKSSPAYSIVLTAVTALASYALFELERAPGWPYFSAGLAVVLGAGAFLGARRDPRLAQADLLSAAGLATLAILDGFSGWHVTLGWSLLAMTLLLAPLPRLRDGARHAGRIVALLAVVHLAAVDALVVDNRLLAFLAAAAAVGSINTKGARWGGVLLASLGIAVEIATSRGANPWWTLTLLTEATRKPSTRLLAVGTLALLPALYAYFVKNRRALIACGASAAALVAAEALFYIDGNGWMPVGMIAAAVLVIAAPHSRSIWPVAVALCVAVAFDLLPPADYIPFLNRRAFAIGSVLGAGWFLLRGRPEGTATVLMGMLLGAAELASMPDRAGGANPWAHLLLVTKTAPDVMPFLNARFLFLVGAAATAFLASRRWWWFNVVGHVYLVTALGAEAVGLASPELRSAPAAIFHSPGQAMGPHLALTGVILAYGAVQITAGIARNRALARRVGLGLLMAGALKVCLIDLIGLHELYRVGSFLVLGATYLAGSYAYNRWLSDAGPGAGDGPASGPEGGAAAPGGESGSA